MARIKLTRDFLRPTFKKSHGALLAGAPNPIWNDILELVVDTVFKYLLDQDDGAVTIDNMNVDKWDIPTIVTWCGSGVGQYGQNVLNYAAFVKLPLANLVDNVPLHLTGSRFINPDGTNGARKKWSEWSVINPPQTDTHAYIAMNPGGVDEDGKTIARLVGDGFTVLQAKQARNQLEAYRATQNPGP